MGFITTTDGVDIFFKDWGPKDAQPIVFHHGWPPSETWAERPRPLRPGLRRPRHGPLCR
jgi:pimeloyl-ACP methyl ester carboxylesterase